MSGLLTLAGQWLVDKTVTRQWPQRVGAGMDHAGAGVLDVEGDVESRLLVGSGVSLRSLLLSDTAIPPVLAAAISHVRDSARREDRGISAFSSCI
jgi:hypothetical protein